MREIADKSNAYLLSDMAHISGLVAAGEQPPSLLVVCIRQAALASKGLWTLIKLLSVQARQSHAMSNILFGLTVTDPGDPQS